MKTLIRTYSLSLARRATCVAAICALFAGPTAVALEKSAQTFAAMDTNGDAVVTESEYVTYATNHEAMDPEGAKLRFEVLAGQDGQLTEAEFGDALEILAPSDADPTEDLSPGARGSR